MLEWQFTLLLLSNGVLIGLMYALIALGFVLVYKATDAVNFAQGEFVMIAGFVVAGCLGVWGVPLWLAVPLALGSMVAFGFVLERVMLRKLIGRPVIAVRSEEHTSELQSHHDLVCRLLPEIKKRCAVRPGPRRRSPSIPAPSTVPRPAFPADTGSARAW